MYHSQIMDSASGAVARRARAAVSVNEVESIRQAHLRIARLEGRAAVWDRSPLGIRRRAYWTHQAIFGQKKWIDFWSPNSTVLITDEHQDDPHDLAFRVNCSVIDVVGEPCPPPCAAPYEPPSGWDPLTCTYTAQDMCFCLEDFCATACLCDPCSSAMAAADFLSPLGDVDLDLDGDLDISGPKESKVDRLVASGEWIAGTTSKGEPCIRPATPGGLMAAAASARRLLAPEAPELPELVPAQLAAKAGKCCGDDAPPTRRAKQAKKAKPAAVMEAAPAAGVQTTRCLAGEPLVCIPMDFTLTCDLPADVVRANPTDRVQQCVTKIIDGVPTRTCIAVAFTPCTDDPCGQGPLGLDCPPDSEPNP